MRRKRVDRPTQLLCGSAFQLLASVLLVRTRRFVAMLTAMVLKISGSGSDSGSGSGTSGH